MRRQQALLLSIVGAVAVVLAVAGAALATDPSASPSGPPAASASTEATSTPPPTVGPASPAPRSTPAATPKATATPKAAETQEVEPAPSTLKGVLTTRMDADGDMAYFIGATRLGIGPPWFWGDKNPLAPYVGKTVTLTGHMDEGKPASTNPSGKVKAAEGPEFEVYTVNGTAVRSPGKPAWAGGPKVVGENHPGYKGWSQGQAGKVKTPKP